MSTPPKQPKRRVLTEPSSVEHYAKATRDGVFNLTLKEKGWQARQEYLNEHGYLLRPRYLPGWKPSWIGTNYDPVYCEDAIMLLLVAIKVFLRQGNELQIAQFLTSIRSPRNHCVPVYEILPDPYDAQNALLVMPYLRPCNNPEFATVGDVVQFVDQTIEGLVFMHEHNVAHRDIAVSNVMMDARALYPNGHHPVRLDSSPGVQTLAIPLPRTGRDVRYFYIDFGLSSRFSEGSSTLVTGDVGRAYVPELTSEAPYDAFKVDIYALGELYRNEFEKKFSNVEFLLPLIELMMQKAPALRPTAFQLSLEWQNIRSMVNDMLLRWRLVPKNEQPLERVVNDTVAVAWEGVYRLKKIVIP